MTQTNSTFPDCINVIFRIQINIQTSIQKYFTTISKTLRENEDWSYGPSISIILMKKKNIGPLIRKKKRKNHLFEALHENNRNL